MIFNVRFLETAQKDEPKMAYILGGVLHNKGNATKARYLLQQNISTMHLLTEKTLSENLGSQRSYCP